MSLNNSNNKNNNGLKKIKSELCFYKVPQIVLFHKKLMLKNEKTCLIRFNRELSSENLKDKMKKIKLEKIKEKKEFNIYEQIKQIQEDIKYKKDYKIRVLWKHYYQNTDILIFVVDSNDRDRIQEASEELKKMLDEKELKDCAVLIFANKQDINGALSPGEVSEKLGMSNLKGRSWLVQGSSAITGQGLKEGLDWMASVILKGINK